MSVGILFFPHESFSEEENRALSSFPSFRTEDIISGRFFSRLSSFCTDAIPMRVQMIRAKAALELALGKSQNNGVLFLGDGRLVDRLEYEDTQKLSEKLALINKHGEDSKAYAVAIVPRSADIYLDGEQTERIYSLVSDTLGEWTLCDKLKSAEGRGESVYYKTDHHLSVDGAYILYSHVVEEFGFEAYPRDYFSEQIFCTDFLGTTYSKCGLLPVSYDTVTLLRYEGDASLSVKCCDSGCELDSLYCTEAANIKDKYRVFTDGNHGILQISSGENRPTLLIYKDSFANAVLPMLALHFDLVACDTRYTDVTPPACDYTAIIMGVDTLNS